MRRRLSPELHVVGLKSRCVCSETKLEYETGGRQTLFQNLQEIGKYLVFRDKTLRHCDNNVNLLT